MKRILILSACVSVASYFVAWVAFYFRAPAIDGSYFDWASEIRLFSTYTTLIVGVYLFYRLVPATFKPLGKWAVVCFSFLCLLDVVFGLWFAFDSSLQFVFDNFGVFPSSIIYLQYIKLIITFSVFFFGSIYCLAISRKRANA